MRREEGGLPVKKRRKTCQGESEAVDSARCGRKVEARCALCLQSFCGKCLVRLPLPGDYSEEFTWACSGCFACIQQAVGPRQIPGCDDYNDILDLWQQGRFAIAQILDSGQEWALQVPIELVSGSETE